MFVARSTIALATVYQLMIRFVFIILVSFTQQNRGVMVTLKKCKFLQLCGHQIGVQLTLPSCIFTPKWCKYDLHTILNAFKNTFAVLQQH